MGFKGYWLPPPPPQPTQDTSTTTPGGGACGRDLDFSYVNASLESGYYSHLNLLYADSVGHDVDVDVDVLGGLAGVAYRSGFFDLRRLADYEAWHSGAYFVDDDWISLTLDASGVPRLVLGLRRDLASAAYAFRDRPLIAPHHAVSALNSESHAYRNVAFQAALLEEARGRGLFAPKPPRFADSGMARDVAVPLARDGGVLAAALERAEARRFASRCSTPLAVVAARADADAVLVLDRFLNHHESGSLLVAGPISIDAARLSARATVADGPAAAALFAGAAGAGADVLLLGPAPTSDAALGDLAAAFGGGLVARGATVVVADGPEGDARRALLASLGCDVVAASEARAAVVCPSLRPS